MAVIRFAADVFVLQQLDRRRFPMTVQAPRSAFKPLKIGPLTLRNRFIKAATNEGMSRKMLPTVALVKHHQDVAAGGVGMTTVAYCSASLDGRTFDEQLLLTNEAMPYLRVLTGAVHKEGAAISAQITHCGCFSLLEGLSDKRPMSASGGFNPTSALVGHYFKRAMTEADLQQVADEFVAGARVASDAGFDAVEIHMGHGYLLSQFLSPKYNRRTDRYGGGPAQRATYPALVLRRVLDAAGKDLAVVCKISVNEYFVGGNTPNDTARIAPILEHEGAHLLVLSGGMNVESTWGTFGNPLPLNGTIKGKGIIGGLLGWAASKRQGHAPAGVHFHELFHRADSLKIRSAVKMPLAYLGGVLSVDGVQTVLADGFDAIVMGRALIEDPGLVGKFRDGRTARSGCISCNQCVLRMYTPGGTDCVLHAPNDPALNAEPVSLP